MGIYCVLHLGWTPVSLGVAQLGEGQGTAAVSAAQETSEHAPAGVAPLLPPSWKTPVQPVQPPLPSSASTGRTELAALALPTHLPPFVAGGGVRAAARAGALHGLPRRLVRRAHLPAAGAPGHRGHVARQGGEEGGRKAEKGGGHLWSFMGWQGNTGRQGRSVRHEPHWLSARSLAGQRWCWPVGQQALYGSAELPGEKGVLLCLPSPTSPLSSLLRCLRWASSSGTRASSLKWRTTSTTNRWAGLSMVEAGVKAVVWAMDCLPTRA